MEAMGRHTYQLMSIRFVLRLTFEKSRRVFTPGLATEAGLSVHVIRAASPILASHFFVNKDLQLQPQLTMAFLRHFGLPA